MEDIFRGSVTLALNIKRYNKDQTKLQIFQLIVLNRISLRISLKVWDN
jgi:hypothetical protein